ncbi:MAG: hypothetical protein CVU56_22545 [Deltaproteobacteria bacterium HGW-Deltaproteobacteria-14]|jgi:hypothetical protein|nr:MAG: hypothetical protein CVU56_22545 [Deltaproteobacteria bacterium HGW-Deltaproteobacteria-14]
MAADDYEATGILYKKLDAEQITPRFRKRELVLELPGRYPQLVSFELTGDRCEALDPFDVGAELRVVFRLKGREWTGRGGEVRYFNSLDVLDVARVGPEPAVVSAPTSPTAGPPAPIDAPMPAASDAPTPDDADAPWFDEDDIPF